jgi:mannitol/fructose-specific phosphotransferase system IIA component (Ntr-type)
VNVSRPPGDLVCPSCGASLWVPALVEVTRRHSFVPDLRIAALQAHSCEEAFRELAQAIAQDQQWTEAQQDRFLKSALDREHLAPTGIGRGFAIPHATVDWINSFVTALAFAPHGIPFDSLDGQPVHTIFMIASPKSRPGDHLRLLERISHALSELHPPT